MWKFCLATLLLVGYFTACNRSVYNNTSGVSSNTSTASDSNRSVSAQTVTIDSSDGLELTGTYLDAGKPDSPALLLLHQWQSDRHSYDAFAKRMYSKGFNVLSIDGRGFGESNKKANGSNVSAERSDEAVKKMLGDVGAAFEFLARQSNVDRNRVAIVGASYGSSLAIIYAAAHPEIHAVALLSPGLNYFGNMQTKPAVEKYGDRDLFVVASKNDTESAEAVENFEKVGNTRYGFMVLPVGNSHGTEMFKYRDKTDGPPVVEDALETFFVTRLGLAEAGYN